MKKKVKILLMAFALTATLGVIAACGGENTQSTPQVQFQTSEGYIQWKYENQAEWNNLISLEELKGDEGKNGEDGEDGKNGLSAYEIAVQNGFKGSETAWLKALKGESGNAGKSAYEIAQENGFEGSKEEWLETLNGEQGENGLSAYEIAVKNGFKGTEEEWLASLKGEKGDEGDPSINIEGEGTDGLWFRAVIRKGIAGYEVIGYDGTETDVVIPDKVLGESVISILQDALPTNITSLKISKNTVSLPEFEDYTELTTFDFNNAPIESITKNMFYDTSLREVKNYSNITEIGANAFRNTAIIDFDFSNIVSIDTYAFYNVDWGKLIEDDSEVLEVFEKNNMFLYITDNVTSIGVNAFSDQEELPVYYEGDGEVEYSGNYFFTNVKHTEDGYYYRDMDTYASLLNYDGEEVTLIVPKSFDGLSLTNVEKYAFAMHGRVERIELPSSISAINIAAFSYTTKLHSLFIPDSLEFVDEDIVYHLGVLGGEYCTVFFEAESFDYGDLTSEDIAADTPKALTGIKPSDIIDDDTCIYLKKLLSYEVVSIKNKAGLVEIPTTVNGLPVTKIGSYALYGGYHKAMAVDIPSSVTKISSKAFCSTSNLKTVNVPTSVEDINNYGFYYVSNCTVYIEAKSIPEDWDSSWYSSINSYRLGTKADYSQTGEYLYETVDGKVYLSKYLGEIDAGDTLVIPTKIDGKDIYGVRSYCYKSSVTNSSSKRINIVVDSSITVMESYAIYFNEYYTYVNLYVGYTQNEGRPTDWNSNWIYQYSSSSSYRTYYYVDQWEYDDGVLTVK